MLTRNTFAAALCIFASLRETSSFRAKPHQRSKGFTNLRRMIFASVGEDPRTGRWRGKKKTECGLH